MGQISSAAIKISLFSIYSTVNLQAETRVDTIPEFGAIEIWKVLGTHVGVDSKNPCILLKISQEFDSLN